jgi:hypothetical protein
MFDSRQAIICEMFLFISASKTAGAPFKIKLRTPMSLKLRHNSSSERGCPFSIDILEENDLLTVRDGSRRQRV